MTIEKNSFQFPVSSFQFLDFPSLSPAIAISLSLE